MNVRHLGSALGLLGFVTGQPRPRTWRPPARWLTGAPPNGRNWFGRPRRDSRGVAEAQRWLPRSDGEGRSRLRRMRQLRAEVIIAGLLAAKEIMEREGIRGTFVIWPGVRAGWIRSGELTDGHRGPAAPARTRGDRRGGWRLASRFRPSPIGCGGCATRRRFACGSLGEDGRRSGQGAEWERPWIGAPAKDSGRRGLRDAGGKTLVPKQGFEP